MRTRWHLIDMNDEPRSSILAASKDDPAAFAAFYAHFADEVLVYLTRRTLDAEVALDLTAETFAQAFVGRGRYRGSTLEQDAAWIKTIARRLLGRYVRRGHAEQRAVKRLGIEYEQLTTDRRAAIESLAGVHPLIEIVRRELANLAEEQKEALELRIVQELPYPEVARRLQISEQAARARVSRGLRKLARVLEPLKSQEA